MASDSFAGGRNLKAFVDYLEFEWILISLRTAVGVANILLWCQHQCYGAKNSAVLNSKKKQVIFSHLSSKIAKELLRI